jgi:hypothetical protein
MSNPTTKAATFNGSLDGFTGVDPIRYSSGLWLEEASANSVYNPVAAINATAWFDGTNVTVSQETSLPGPLPAPLAGLVTTAIKFTATGDATGAVAAGTANPAAAGTYAIGAYVWVPTAFSATSLVLQGQNFVGSSGVNGTVDLAKRDQWQWVTGSISPVSGDLNGHVRLQILSGTMTSGQVVWATVVCLFDESYPTSPIAEVLGTGYANTGAAHNSPSTRAASSASISPTGILAPGSGAIAFRLTPTIETGLEEIWGECGTKGTGTDHIQWGRDASKHPFVEWSSDDGSYQRLTSVETADAGTEHFVLIGHNGTDVFIKAAGGARESGTRDAVEGSFGAGDLVLKASVGGNVVGSLATFNRMLTDAEIYTVEHTEHWSMGMLGNEMVRRIRAQFELRPY